LAAGNGKLKGKVAIVTGASRGIGRAIAKKLAEEGARVVVNYNSSSKEAEDLQREITESGGEALLFKADVGMCRAWSRRP
jgi:3-oxoacyl-[acyl-carrier protein] reductase